MRIKSIREVYTEESIPVYDIEVPRTANFVLSSGVVVHNSKDGADSLAGSLYNAMLNEDEIHLDIADNVINIVETNTDNTNKLNMNHVSSVHELIKDKISSSMVGSMIDDIYGTDSQYNIPVIDDQDNVEDPIELSDEEKIRRFKLAKERQSKGVSNYSDEDMRSIIDQSKDYLDSILI